MVEEPIQSGRGAGRVDGAQGARRSRRMFLRTRSAAFAMEPESAGPRRISERVGSLRIAAARVFSRIPLATEWRSPAERRARERERAWPAARPPVVSPFSVTGPRARVSPASARARREVEAQDAGTSAARRVELFWRAAPAGVPGLPAEPRIEHAARALRESYATLRERAHVEGTSAARARAFEPTPALLPEVLDRLAEDVIRRVDRRARIERERRGSQP